MFNGTQHAAGKAEDQHTATDVSPAEGDLLGSETLDYSGTHDASTCDRSYLD
jgi:hypothetical protein